MQEALKNLYCLCSNKSFEEILNLQDFAPLPFSEMIEEYSEGAHIGLQTIITARPPATLSEIRDTRFLLKEVFPGSALPSLSDIQASAADLYEIRAVKRIGSDYARTLTEWLSRLQDAKSAVIARFSPDLFEHYQNYFESARRSFEAGVVDLVQLSLKRARPLKLFK